MDDQQPEVKAEQAPAPVKKEAPIVAETKVLDGAAPTATSGKKKNSAKKQKTEPGNDDTVVPHANFLLSFFEISGHVLKLKPEHVFLKSSRWSPCSGWLNSFC